MLISQRRSRLNIAAGQTIFRLDDTADLAYIVVEGLLLVSQFSQEGREVITSIFFPGETCGGFSVLTDMSHNGTARAPSRSAAVVDVIRRAQLLDLVRLNPSYYGILIATQREKERFKDRMLLGLFADTCEQRVAWSLLWLARKTSESSRPLQRFQLCRQELADLVGTTVETVIRVLSSFRKRGLLTERDGRVKIDALALAELATPREQLVLSGT